MQETLVRFLGWEDLLEKGQATHSSILGFPLWLSWLKKKKKSSCNAGDPCSIPGSGSSAEEVGYPLQYSWASLEAQQVKNLPAMWENWVQFLGWEDPLEKGNKCQNFFFNNGQSEQKKDSVS